MILKNNKYNTRFTKVFFFLPKYKKYVTFCPFFFFLPKYIFKKSKCFGKRKWHQTYKGIYLFITKNWSVKFRFHKNVKCVKLCRLGRFSLYPQTPLADSFSIWFESSVDHKTLHVMMNKMHLRLDHDPSFTYKSVAQQPLQVWFNFKVREGAQIIVLLLQCIN